MSRIGEALESCVVRNGEIIFEQSLTDLELREIYEVLRVAIQDGKLSHYKVIGISYTAGGITAEDYVSKLRGANRSYVETFIQLQQVIFGSVKGERLLLGTTPVWKLVSNGKDIRSDNESLLWEGTGESVADSLICDVPVLKTTSESNILSLLVTAGQGFSDFDAYTEGLSRFNKENATHFAPVAQYFNLSPYLVIRRYRDGDGVLRFTYKSNINESVLTQLLNTFGAMYMGGM